MRHIVRAKDRRLVGCQVTAAYRLLFDPSEGFQDTGIQGTLEGLVVRSCGAGKCLDFTGFPLGSHANPWSVGGHLFHVVDFNGNPTPTADVITLGVHGPERGPSDQDHPGGTGQRRRHHAGPFRRARDRHRLRQQRRRRRLGHHDRRRGARDAHLTGVDITTLLVDAPQNETLILELCTSGPTSPTRGGDADTRRPPRAATGR